MQELNFENFLTAVELPYQEPVKELHDSLTGSGCKLKLQTAKGGGYVVSYLYGKSKKTVLNFVFRKSGLMARIYGDNTGEYAEFLDTLPDSMVSAIEKASECKSCNSRCPKGYIFSIGGKEYNRCRYNSFMFPVDDESIPFVRTFVENEIKARAV